MAIATITPQNRTQVNLLAQALNGSTGSLAQALNSAIQRSTLDLQIQAQQGQNLVQEQARNLEREQQERFDLRNRAENAFEMNELKKSNDIVNQGRLQDQSFQQVNQEYDVGQRDILQEAGATRAEQEVFGFERAKKNSVIEDRERSIKIENQIRKEEIDKKQADLIEKNDGQVEIMSEALIDDKYDVDMLDDAKLKSTLEFVENSTNKKDPDVIRMKVKLQDEMAKRERESKEEKMRRDLEIKKDFESEKKEDVKTPLFSSIDDAYAVAGAIKDEVSGFREAVPRSGTLASESETAVQFHNALLAKGLDINFTQSKKLYEAEQFALKYAGKDNKAVEDGANAAESYLDYLKRTKSQ